jgi:hypothetical protein
LRATPLFSQEVNSRSEATVAGDGAAAMLSFTHTTVREANLDTVRNA